MFERPVERVEHAGQARGHGLADGWSHHRKQRVGERRRVALDRGGDGLFERRRQRAGEIRIVRVLHQHLRQHFPDVLGAGDRILEARLQRHQPVPLAAPEDSAERRDLGVGIRFCPRPPASSSRGRAARSAAPAIVEARDGQLVVEPHRHLGQQGGERGAVGLVVAQLG